MPHKYSSGKQILRAVSIAFVLLFATSWLTLTTHSSTQRRLANKITGFFSKAGQRTSSASGHIANSSSAVNLAQTETNSIRQLSIATKDIVYDPFSQMIYASVPSSASSNGNSITEINPVAGTIGPSVFVGSEPTKLALSDNGQYLYVALDG